MEISLTAIALGSIMEPKMNIAIIVNLSYTNRLPVLHTGMKTLYPLEFALTHTFVYVVYYRWNNVCRYIFLELVTYYAMFKHQVVFRLIYFITSGSIYEIIFSHDLEYLNLIFNFIELEKTI